MFTCMFKLTIIFIGTIGNGRLRNKEMITY